MLTCVKKFQMTHIVFNLADDDSLEPSFGKVADMDEFADDIFIVTAKFLA